MITNNDIRRFLKLPPVAANYEVLQVDSLGLHDNTLMFINKPDINLSELDGSLGSVYIIDQIYPEFLSCRNDFIRVPNPKFTFCKIVESFRFKSRLQIEFDRDRLLGNHYLDKLYCLECIIGERCNIYSGAIIGGTDFSPVVGSSREELVQFPQLGGVILGDNVVVKYNTMIGKGTFGYTQIGDNTMIDYGCQIGHNCIIGKSCIIAAGTIIGGSTTVGDCTTIGIGAKIRNGIKIGRNVSIGMGAVVIKDIPDDCVVVGNPARIIEHKHIIDEGGLV